MQRYQYDPSIANGWKSYPIRLLSSLSSRCCGRPVFLVQSMAGGLVSANCSECNKPASLTHREFLDLPVWVNCPQCHSRMTASYVPPNNKNYGYTCEKCQLYVWLADLLPHYLDA